jgi:Ca2+-binding RTX toxin-like protein
VTFTRSIGNITMDLHGVERIDTNTLGGADALTVQDLSGTGVSNLLINEAASSGTPDGVSDRITVDGTVGADEITVGGSPAAGVAITGLSSSLQITGSDPIDGLDIEAAQGDDVVVASDLEAGAVSFSADGGDGADVLVGSAGDDTLHGGTGDDVLEGGPGEDVLDGGSGSNTVIQ